MQIISVNNIALHGPLIIAYERFCDGRGYFSEHYREKQLQEFIPGFSVAQANESFSKKHTLRGLHAQWEPHMGKLVRTIQGHMLDLILDIRPASGTFGEIAIIDMPACSENRKNTWLWVPPGFAHGNFFLTDTTIEYFCTATYAGAINEVSFSPFSPDIDWSAHKKEKETLSSLREQLIQSEKDQQGITLSEWQTHPGINFFKDLS